MKQKKTESLTTLQPALSKELINLFKEMIMSIIQTRDNEEITGIDAINLSEEKTKINKNIEIHAENALKYVTDRNQSHLIDIIKIQLGNLDGQTNSTIRIPIKKRDPALKFLTELRGLNLSPEDLLLKLQQSSQYNAAVISNSPPPLPLRAANTTENPAIEIISLLKMAKELTNINATTPESKKEQIKKNYVELSNDITHVIKFYFNRIKYNN